MGNNVIPHPSGTPTLMQRAIDADTVWLRGVIAVTPTEDGRLAPPRRLAGARFMWVPLPGVPNPAVIDGYDPATDFVVSAET